MEGQQRASKSKETHLQEQLIPDQINIAEYDCKRFDSIDHSENEVLRLNGVAKNDS